MLTQILYIYDKTISHIIQTGNV